MPGCQWLQKGVRSSSLARYNVDANMDRHERNLAQLQFLLLEMERQLLIISTMIDWLRSRWGLPGVCQLLDREDIGSGLGQPRQSLKKRVSTAD